MEGGEVEAPGGGAVDDDGTTDARVVTSRVKRAVAVAKQAAVFDEEEEEDGGGAEVTQAYATQLASSNRRDQKEAPPLFPDGESEPPMRWGPDAAPPPQAQAPKFTRDDPAFAPSKKGLPQQGEGSDGEEEEEEEEEAAAPEVAPEPEVAAPAQGKP
mmetsp:Transcript_15020/g.34921  ORF Transcript_15020/g.34921 Transcript_15020/m.34921 type:complete len:157 (-) Transcript_15020:40-510(-)